MTQLFLIFCQPVDDTEIHELCFEANIKLFESYDMLLLDLFISTLRFSEMRLLNFKKHIDVKLRNDAKALGEKDLDPSQKHLVSSKL